MPFPYGGTDFWDFSNGGANFYRLREMTEALNQITQELHNQYSLSYISDNQNYDGNFHKVEITSKQGTRIQARKGYYATPR